MSNQILPNPDNESLRVDLQGLFSPHANVVPVQLSNPMLIEEFRPGAKHDTDYGHLPKPSLDWAWGVECGTVQGDERTCALVFTHFSRLECFLAQNPSLVGTLVTAWNGALVAWLRVSGQIPANFRADGVRWCAGGIVLVGCPELLNEKFLQEGQIKVLKFSQLVWSDVQQAAIDRVLVEAEVGLPFTTVERGRRRINPAFWAKWIMTKFSFRYDADRKALGWIDPSVGIPEWHSDDNSLRVLGELLQFEARSFPGGFPDGELRPLRVRQILERIKLLAKPDRTCGGLLDRFLETQIVLAPGCDITSLEIRDKYVTYCHALGRAPSSQSRFFRLLKAKLHSMGVDQRHDIERNDKSVRGYGGLAFKTELPPKTSDTADGTDVSDAAPNTTSK